MESQLGIVEQSLNSSYSLWVREALDEIPDNFTITDPCISGHPIVFASRGFLKMTGYAKSEVIGRNGRIFQGPKTCRRSVMEVREAVREERAIQINLLNYRKDGRPFWMLFHMCPVFSKEDGRVISFIAVQVPLSRRARRSGAGFCRSGVNLLSEEASRISDVVYGTCRREVWSDSLLELSRVCALDSVLGSDVSEREIEEPCEASDVDKNEAASAINRVLSVLTHYSESTGRLVCGKRCGLSGVGLLSSSLTISLGRIKQSFVLTDPHLSDMPIVYASDAFLKLTGYSRHEVLGRNCRFLNGEDTDSLTVHKIEENIQMERACTVRILSYRKDKSSFWNSLHISPVRNASGKIRFLLYIGADRHRVLECPVYTLCSVSV
ncbi:protein TWIN LOV 1 isoform X2 [Humulus lupulus]|uniref:protein TWIN LOV 1 isoform X2 n=1 Tax=Humulus lupulus TaxID=3486 RepID=UPI002B40E271|nr:protein TWIN LOV 1 isoform X2 [Humulus lupulus]